MGLWVEYSTYLKPLKRAMGAGAVFLHSLHFLPACQTAVSTFTIYVWTSRWLVVCRCDSVALEREGGGRYSKVKNRNFPHCLTPAYSNNMTSKKNKQLRNIPHSINPIISRNFILFASQWWVMVWLRYVHSWSLFAVKAVHACIQY